MPKLPSLKQAKALLETITSAEQAVKLVGPEREAYLKALDVVHGPRAERMASMGFDKERLFHGSTSAPFDSFDTAMAGKQSGHQNTSLGGVWLSSDPKVAKNYTMVEDGVKAKDGHIRELRSRADNPVELSASSHGIQDFMDKDTLAQILEDHPKADQLTIHDSPGETMFTDPEALSRVTLAKDPSKLRDINAAYDPRFKNSNKLMAGMAGAGVLGASALGNNEAEAGALPKWKIGKEIIEAANPMAARRLLAEEGKVSHAAQITKHVEDAKNGTVRMGKEVEPVANEVSKKKFVPGIAALGAPQVNVNPMDALRDVGQAWQQHIVDPISEQLRHTLTPDMQVGNSTYPTSSAVSDGIINMASDPINYVPGGAGAMLGGAQMAAQYSDGGIVKAGDDGLEAYDVSGAEPQLGTLHHDDVEQALTSGQFALPQNRELDVISPDGQLGTIPAADVKDALQQGYKYATPALKRTNKFGTDKEGAKAMLEGAADTATWGLAGAATNAANKVMPSVFASPEDRLARKEENPGSYMAGQVLGLFAPGGAGGLMTRAGEAVAAKLAAKTVMGRIGSAAAKGAVENVIFAGGDETAKLFMSDPHQTAESAMTNLGLSAVIGGALGGATGGVGELWDMGPGKKITETLTGLKAKADGLTPEAAKLAGLNLSPEVLASLEPGFAREQGVALQQSDTLAGRHFQKNLDGTYTKIENEVHSTLGKTTQDVEKLADISEHSAGTEGRKTLQKEVKATYEPITAEYEQAEQKLTGANIHPETHAELATDLTNIISTNGLEKAVDESALKLVQKTIEKLGKQETAQDLRLMAQNLADAHPYGSPTYKVAKQVIAAVKKAQDATMVRAAETVGGLEFATQFKALQSRYRQYRGVLDDIASYAGIGRIGGTEDFIRKLTEKLDGADFARRFSKDSVELRQLLEQNFPETAAHMRQHELDMLLAKSRTKAGNAIDINKLSSNLEKLDPESRAAMLNSEQLSKLAKLHDIASNLPKNDNYSGTAKAISRAWGYLPAAAGGMAGMLSGDDHNALLALIAGAAAHQAGPALRLAALKFLASEAPVSARGFKAVIDMAKNAAKGEKKMEEAAEAVFSKGKNGTAEVDSKAIEKLKGQVDAISAEPKLLMGMGDHLDHYMPEVATASAETASRNIMYLASLRPQTAPLSPLDGIRKVSKQEESEYERALQIAENPLVVLDHVRNGRLDPKDLQHLENLHPKSYERMQQKLTQQLVKNLDKGVVLPYKTQMGMSVFLKQPMASSLQPQAIMAAQPKPQMTSMRPPSASSMKGLQKMPGMFQTPQQARQSRKLK